jgi:hypothetical protein
MPQVMRYAIGAFWNRHASDNFTVSARPSRDTKPLCRMP